MTDEDAEQGEIDDYLMGIAWVDCGLISFPVGGGYASYEGDPADLLTTLGEDASLLPAEVSQNLDVRDRIRPRRGDRLGGAHRPGQRRLRGQLQPGDALDHVPCAEHRRDVHAHDRGDRPRQQRHAAARGDPVPRRRLRLGGVQRRRPECSDDHDWGTGRPDDLPPASTMPPESTMPSESTMPVPEVRRCRRSRR